MLAKEIRTAYLALAVAIVCFSFSSILIRYSDAPSPAIAAYRMLLASLIIAPLALHRSRPEIVRLERRDSLLLVFIGVVLAFHFLFFVTAVKTTSVASATVLINAHPIIVAIMAFAILGEGSKWTAIGAILGMLGIGFISFSEYGTDNFTGDILAFLGAVMESVYIIMTRFMRRRIGILAFIFVVNTACALMLIGICVAEGVPLWPYSTDNLIVFLAMAVVPAVIGYTLYNYSLRWLMAPQVSVIQLGEAVLATLMAAVLFAELPAGFVFIGGALILLGIVFVVQANRKNGRKDHDVAG